MAPLPHMVWTLTFALCSSQGSEGQEVLASCLEPFPFWMSWGIDDIFILLKFPRWNFESDPLVPFMFSWNTAIAYLTSTECLEPVQHSPPPLQPRHWELLWINVFMSPICMHLGMVTWGSNQPWIDHQMSNIEYDHGLCAYLIVVFYVSDQRREILSSKLLYFWVIGVYHSNVAYVV